MFKQESCCFFTGARGNCAALGCPVFLFCVLARQWLAARRNEDGSATAGALVTKNVTVKKQRRVGVQEPPARTEEV